MGHHVCQACLILSGGGVDVDGRAAPHPLLSADGRVLETHVKGKSEKLSPGWLRSTGLGGRLPRWGPVASCGS